MIMNTFDPKQEFFRVMQGGHIKCPPDETLEELAQRLYNNVVLDMIIREEREEMDTYREVEIDGRLCYVFDDDGYNVYDDDDDDDDEEE